MSAEGLYIGLEGMMLAGSLVGFAAGYFSSNLWVGSLAAMLVGVALGLLLGFYTISLASNQVVAGIALNLLVVGVTGFAYRALFGSRQRSRASIRPLSKFRLSAISRCSARYSSSKGRWFIWRSRWSR